MSKDNYKMVKIEEITFPSFIPKSESPTNDLITSIESHGILHPIGICRNDQKVSEHKYLVIWGRKRLLAAHQLDIKEIPSVIIDIKPSREEFLKYSLMDAQTPVSMGVVDVWNAIRELYIEHGDERIISKMTGIPLPVVRDALKSQIIDRLKGGRDLYTHVTETCALPAQMAHKVLEVVRKPDNVSVDKSKGEKLADVLATQDVQMRNKIIKAALNTPQGDVDGWVAVAKSMKNYKTRKIELVDIEDEALKEYAMSLGMAAEDIIKDLTLNKLQEDGFI
jgi:hypothetical protein